MTPETTGHVPSNRPLFATVSRAAAPLLGDEFARRGMLWDSLVVTMAGLQPVQSLQVGSVVVTRHSGAAMIKRVEQISCMCRGIYVLAGSLGHRKSDRDSLLPAGQPVLVRDWRARALTREGEALIPAKALTDGEFVRDVGLLPMTLFQITLDRPGVLYADGMELGCCTPYELWAAPP